MSELESTIENILGNKDVVVNLKQLEDMVGGDDQNKMTIVNKGILDYCQKELQTFPKIEHENIMAIASLLTVLLTYNEGIKSKIIELKIGQQVCKIIKKIEYSDSSVTDMTLNNLYKLVWGLFSVQNDHTRRKLLTKSNINKLLESYKKIESEETATTGINVFASISIYDNSIPFFSSTSMIKDCIELAQRFVNSESVTVSILSFIANAVFTEDEYKIAKDTKMFELIKHSFETFKSEEDVISIEIAAIRTISNSCDEARKKIIDFGFDKMIFDIINANQSNDLNEHSKIEEKATEFFCYFSQTEAVIPSLINLGVLKYLTHVLECVNTTNNPDLSQSRKSLIRMVRNNFITMVNITFNKTCHEEIIKSNYVEQLSKTMKLTIQDKTCQSRACTIVQGLALKEENCATLFNNGIVDNVTEAFKKYLKCKEVCIPALQTLINLSQNVECSKRIVENSTIDFFETLYNRFSTKEKLTGKIVTCLMNLLIHNEVCALISEHASTLIHSIFNQYNKNNEIMTKLLVCITAITKNTKGKPIEAIIKMLPSLVQNVNIDDLEINCKIIQIICSISVNKENEEYLKEGGDMFKFIYDNAMKHIDQKVIIVNSLICLMNFACFKELTEVIITNDFIQLAKQVHEKCIQQEKTTVCLMNTFKNLATVDKARDLLKENNVHFLVMKTLEKHQANEDIYKACIGSLWNMSLNVEIAIDIVGEKILLYVKRGLEETFKGNESIATVIIGLLLILTNDESNRKAIKDTLDTTLHSLQLSNTDKLNELLDRIK